MKDQIIQKQEELINYIKHQYSYKLVGDLQVERLESELTALKSESEKPIHICNGCSKWADCDEMDSEKVTCSKFQPQSEPSSKLNAKSLLESALLDISIDVQNELLRQCKKHYLDDWQTDNINESTTAVFDLNKQKYISRLINLQSEPTDNETKSAEWRRDHLSTKSEPRGETAEDEIKLLNETINSLHKAMIDAEKRGCDKAMEEYKNTDLRRELIAVILKDFQIWHNSDSCVEIDDVTIDEYLQSRTTKNK
jgi:hypothetical protein